MKKPIFITIVTLFCNLNYILADQTEENQTLTILITNSLGEIHTIKTGMTRKKLLEVIATEGGLSTGLHRPYVYRGSRIIKVDVVFKPIGGPSQDSEGRVTLKEFSRDIIKKISKPYLQLANSD